MAPWLYLFPKSWRQRYGNEMQSLVESRDRFVADLIDIVRTAAVLRAHQLIRGGNSMVRSLLMAGAALLTAGVVGGAWASTELASGLSELPEHWWSTLSVAPAVAGMLLLALGAASGARRPDRHANR